ncbi:MAG TPA: hypothetical protein VNO50_07830 [Pyrinomonadaceae bacterium]|nr:hypothetical protein [Pyrinomonadaceae bacterium]
MNAKAKRTASVLCLLLLVCISQVFVTSGFVATESASTTSQVQSQGPVGILTTVGNKPISVNGTASITGATILSGAGIETPEGIGATVSLAQLGSLEMEQNARVTLTFEAGIIKVILHKGCVTLHANKGVTGEIETAKDARSKTDPKADGVLRVCHPDSVKLASAAAAGGLGKLATLAIIGIPAAAIIPVVTPGSNPSNSSPQ